MRQADRKGGPQQGCLVIADITGYTAFLSRSELEHAEDCLETLLGLILDKTKPPPVLSQLEGDAVFSYAPAGSFIRGEALVEAIEAMYVAFARALEGMVRNTSCTCNACRNIPTLDLKFFVHFGAFATQKFGSRLELLGNDVNVLHRITKNTITAATGFKAYAAYTSSAVEALGLSGFAGGLARHTERYEHVGEIALFVQDMAPVWQREQARSDLAVRPEQALLKATALLPVPPALAWDYLTEPNTRKIWLMSTSQRLTLTSKGRTGRGAIYQCAHGKMVFQHTIVEWHPFDDVTFESALLAKGISVRITVRLEAADAGTKVTVLFGRGRGPLVWRWLANILLFIPPTIGHGLRALRKRIEADLAAGKVAPASAVAAQADEIQHGVREALRAHLRH